MCETIYHHFNHFNHHDNHHHHHHHHHHNHHHPPKYRLPNIANSSQQHVLTWIVPKQNDHRWFQTERSHHLDTRKTPILCPPRSVVCGVISGTCSGRFPNTKQVPNLDLVGGRPTPLKNMSSSVGKDDIPYMKWKIIQPCLKPPTSGSRSAGHSKTLFKLQLHPPQLQIRSRWCRSFCHSSIKPLDPVPSTLLLTGLYLTMIQTVV